MFFKKKEKRSVELTDIKIDTSEMINIKKARIVFVNGTGKLREVYTEVNNLPQVYLSQIKLNDIPLVQVNSPDCPTCVSLLASGLGIENADCKEILEIQEKINSDFISLENSIQMMEPLLELMETGFYMIADAECYPADGNGNFFWNIPNELTENPATVPKFLPDEDFAFIAGQPAYLYPTQTTDCYNGERINYYIEKFKNSGGNEPRAVVYNFAQFINFVIDGHHKACAAALLGQPLKCLLIMRGEHFKDYSKGKTSEGLFFSTAKILEGDIPMKYLPLKIKKFHERKLDVLKLETGKVNRRKWEDEYINSVRCYPDIETYANTVNALNNVKIKVTEDLLKNCMNNFDKNSQETMKKVIYVMKYTESTKKVQETAVKYAKSTMYQQIDKDLKYLIYSILSDMKNSEEVEQIFIDYIVYNEDKDDPVLELVNSYWER